MFLVLVLSSGAVACLFTAVTVVFRRGRRRPRTDGRSYPFVSLLKPVKAIDDDLAANLESFYRLDYPAYEILFAVDDLGDPCVRLLEEIRATHPEVPTGIVATGHPPFENPKIHKLARLEARSRGELFWATDSNVRVEPDALRRLVDEHLDRGAKLVFSPVRGTSSGTLASLMENTSLNVFTSGGIIAAWALWRRAIVVGKSMLVERAALETFGGFAYFKDYLAEDYLIGEAFARSGFRVSTNYTWVTHVGRSATPRSFFMRMSRWAKLRYRLKPAAYLGEVLLNPVALAAAGAIAVGGRAWTVLALTAAAKVAVEYINFLFVNSGDRRRLRNHLLFPAAVIGKDLVFLAVYFSAFFSREVEWRGGRIAVGRRTLILAEATVDNLVYEGA